MSANYRYLRQIQVLGAAAQAVLAERRVVVTATMPGAEAEALYLAGAGAGLVVDSPALAALAHAANPTIAVDVGPGDRRAHPAALEALAAADLRREAPRALAEAALRALAEVLDAESMTQAR